MPASTRPQNTTASLADQVAQHRADLAQIGQLIAAMPGSDPTAIAYAISDVAAKLHWLECHARSHQPKRLNQ